VITTEMNARGARARRAWMALGIVAALAAAAAGCGDKEPDRADVIPTEADRNLNHTEADSLRAMMATHGVTRDEYWSEQGGVVASDRFEVWYSQRRVKVLEAMAVLKLMDEERVKAEKVFGRVPQERVVVVCAPSLEVYRSATGRDWWHYSLIKGDTISIQTPMLLFTRGLLAVAAQREYDEWAVGKLAAGRAPRWVTEGMASYLSNERPVLEDQRKEYAKDPLRMEPEEIEKALQKDNDRLPVRKATYNAYLMVNQLVEKHGMPAVASFVVALGEEPDANAAAQRAFGTSYDAVLADARGWPEPPAPVVAPAPKS